MPTAVEEVPPPGSHRPSSSARQLHVAPEYRGVLTGRYGDAGSRPLHHYGNARRFSKTGIATLSDHGGLGDDRTRGDDVSAKCIPATRTRSYLDSETLFGYVLRQLKSLIMLQVLVDTSSRPHGTRYGSYNRCIAMLSRDYTGQLVALYVVSPTGGHCRECGPLPRQFLLSSAMPHDS